MCWENNFPIKKMQMIKMTMKKREKVTSALLDTPSASDFWAWLFRLKTLIGKTSCVSFPFTIWLSGDWNKHTFISIELVLWLLFTDVCTTLYNSNFIFLSQHKHSSFDYINKTKVREKSLTSSVVFFILIFSPSESAKNINKINLPYIC